MFSYHKQVSLSGTDKVCPEAFFVAERVRQTRGPGCK